MSTSVDPIFKDLEPAALWARFDEIRRIPRPSRHEERIRRYVIAFAEKHGCETVTDAAGNVVVRVPPREGCEGAPTVVIQGHLDMVCEKDAGTEFDFFNDPIQLRRDGDRLLARGTTLGADNGVAVAAGLALITDPPGPHGPLELLFTVDEETGLNGVRDLDPSIVTGRLLLNLDSEDEGTLTVACVGSRSAELHLPIQWESPGTSSRAFRVSLAGATGGHSGADIHRGRINVLRELARLLGQVSGVRIANVTGGSVRNAIPRESEAVVLADEALLKEVAEGVLQRLQREYGETDPHLSLTVQRLDEIPSRVFDQATAGNLLTILSQVPLGALSMSDELPGMVETSCNLATLRTGETEVEILCSVRSALESGRDAVVDQIADVARNRGATANTPEGYPGWRPDMSSPLLATAVKVYRRLEGQAPELVGVHGGLECAVLGAKIPEMDMISFGPDIANPHSPSEEVSLGSVQRVLGDYLGALLQELAGH